MITLPKETVQAVARAAETLIRRIERDNLHTTQGVQLEPLRAALRELTTVTSMARACAQAEEPRVIDGGMSCENTIAGMWIYDGDGQKVCELTPVFVQGLDTAARAQLAQLVGVTLGLITLET